jgi:hypothetical protein
MGAGPGAADPRRGARLESGLTGREPTLYQSFME